MKFFESWRNTSFLLLLILVALCCLFPVLSIADEQKSSKEVIAKELPSSEQTFGGSPWDRWIFIANGDAFLSLSRLNGAGTVGGGSADLLLAPTYKYDDKTFFIFMYDGHYYKKRDFYSDEIGPRERTEFQGHTIQPMLRRDFGPRDRYSLTPSVFLTYTFNKDIDSERWNEGLYNYRDKGGSLEFDMREAIVPEGLFNCTVQYYKRRYPNYASLLSLTGLDLSTGLNVEKNEKDYDGLLLKSGYSHERPIGFSFQTQYALLYKDLDDKKVVDSDGVLTSDGQEDYQHTVDLNLWYTLDIGGGLRVGMDLRGGLKRSNQNYYDGMETIILSDDEFTSDYYDYNQYRIVPNISYTLAFFPLTASVSYSYQEIRYTDRKAAFADGSYKSDLERDVERVVNFRLSYDLSDRWKLIGQWDHTEARSNNDDERVYRYDYVINTYAIGVAFQY